MATLTPSPPSPPAENLDEVIAHYGAEADIPVEWLTGLHLERPHRNLRELSALTRSLKRATDILGSLAAIVLLAPVALLIAILVKCTSPGPVIYRQVRVGLNRRMGPRERRGAEVDPDAAPEGEERLGSVPRPRDAARRALEDRRRSSSFGRDFTLYKFRTMTVDAEKDGARLAQKHDARVTTVGRFLRRTRLDEIPQFVNILLGQMSIVGPRPERPEFIEKLSREIPGYLGRLGLRPGLSGLAQILNGYDEDLESVRRKVALDLLYLQNCCWRNDLKILLRTVRVVITGHGAR